MHANTTYRRRAGLPFAELWRAAAAAAERLRSRYRDRQDAVLLSSLADDTLKDIGIRRGEILSLIATRGEGRRRAWHFHS